MMNDKRILLVEISGKRPGDKNDRPTEKFDFGNFDKVIISNNSEGYESEWQIVDVPEDYQNYYKDKVKTSDIAYYAPMNRSYAIKYAREHGYDYLVQLDDNLTSFDIRYKISSENKTYDTSTKQKNYKDLPQEMIRYMAKVLEHTNAGVVGCIPRASGIPSDDWIRERYVYSFFIMDLKRVPDIYHGDFEDDIKFRLKLKERKTPMLQICSFGYDKTHQGPNNSDLTGNRMAYAEAGLKRGETMSILHGDVYKAGLSTRGAGTARTEHYGARFRHQLKAFKVGAMVNDRDYLVQEMLKIFEKFAFKKPDKLKIDVSKFKIAFKIVGDYQEVLNKVVSFCIETNSEFERTFYSSVNSENIFVIKSEDDLSEDIFKNISGIEVI